MVYRADNDGSGLCPELWGIVPVFEQHRQTVALC